jgi:hypothetical protein
MATGETSPVMRHELEHKRNDVNYDFRR